MPGGTEFLPASPRGGEGTSALQGLEPLIFVHKVLGLAGALMLRCDLGQVVPSSEGVQLCLYLPAAPQSEMAPGAADRLLFFCLCSGAHPFPCLLESASKAHDDMDMASQDTQVQQGAGSILHAGEAWVGKVPSVPARLLILGAQGQLPSMSCVSCFLASREQWVEAGIGSCVNLSGYEAKEVPPCPLEKVERSFAFTP